MAGAGNCEKESISNPAWEDNAMRGYEHFGASADGERVMDLQRTSDFQAALLGMVGHDLRQPLQVIQSAYECLGSHVGTTSDKVRLQRGERAITRLTEQLDRLVGALRLYESTKIIEVSPVALSPLFCRIGGENEDAALEKGIELRSCPTTACVMSHPELLEGILRNLVRNAVKYTEPGGRILIGCRRSGPNVRIDVYDTGIGIAPEHLPKIFEAFQRLDSTRPDGLGIGLFVVRRAVELLGHRVTVSSAVSRGSRFSVFARASLCQGE
jgi:two-component system phosphate regulon sensor histidine kinase PhoR